MLGQREMTTDDVMGILRRGWLYLTIPFLLGPLIALGIAYFLPAKYTSESLIMIEGQKVPDSVVKSVVQQNLISRVTTMEAQVLSRTMLQPLIDKFGLYRREVARGVGIEDLIQEFRDNTSVTPVPSVMNTPSGSKAVINMSDKDVIPGFVVAFTYDKPKTAQEVCAELVSNFIQVNIIEREKMAEETTTFLGNQLQDAKRKLDEQDAKMAAFQRQYAGELPDEEKDNASLLSSMTVRLEGITQTLQRAQQDKTYMEALLAQLLSAWDAQRSGAHPETTDKEIASLEDRLNALRAHYTDDYPEVARLRATIEQLKRTHYPSVYGAEGDGTAGAKPDDKSQSAQAAQAATPPPAYADPPEIQKLRSQLRSLEDSIAMLRREQAQMAQEAKNLEAKLQMSPVVMEQFKQLGRDYKTALDFYNDLLAKRNNSGMATDLERGAQGEQFTVLDPANLPETPSFPVYWMFGVGGAGGGLLIGLSIVLLREMKDKSIRSERDIEFFLELPTLVALPSVGAMAKRKNGKFRGWWGKRRKPGMETPAEQPV